MRCLAPLALLISVLVLGPALCFGQKLAEEKLPATVTVDLGGDVQMDFVLIPAGTFQMGSDEYTGEGDESPIHKVIFTHAFYLGKYEVTQAQWTQLTGTNPSRFKGPNLPVETVSWHDCQKFLALFREKTSHAASLPTESQWEYACRAGTTTPWSFGATDVQMNDFAWNGENSKATTHAVGTKKPNAWGLHDMAGNVWEWCSDCYQKRGYPTGETTDPQGPTTGDAYVSRGGAWGDNSSMIRSAVRNCAGPEVANQGLGFRIALPVARTP